MAKMTALIERLKSPLPVCPFDRRSPDYWTTSNDKPCHVCGGTEEVDKCRGADTRCMEEAATLLASQEAEIAELRVALVGAERKIVSLYRSINPHGNDDNGGNGNRFADKDEDVIAIRALRPAETGEPT